MFPRPVRADFGGLVIWRRVTVVRKVAPADTWVPINLAKAGSFYSSHNVTSTQDPREDRRGATTGYRLHSGLSHYLEEEDRAGAKGS